VDEIIDNYSKMFKNGVDKLQKGKRTTSQKRIGGKFKIKSFIQINSLGFLDRF
jgi:hypothetical protein